MYKLLVGLALSLIVSTNPAFADVTVTDLAGRTVTLTKPAQRVVLGFYFEDFLAVVGPEAVGKIAALSLSPWKDWRPNQYAAYLKALPALAKIPDVGATDNADFSVEKVIAAMPDLVILPLWAYTALGQNIRQIEGANIPVVVLDYNAQTVDKHVRSTEVLGEVMGAQDRAGKLIENYRAAIADVDSRVKASKAGNSTAYVEVGSKGAGVTGNSYSEDMWGGIINRLGGDNIAKGKLPTLGPLNPEYVVSRNPELVFIAGSEWIRTPGAVTVGFGIDERTTRERIKPYFSRPGWFELAAVKNGNVHVLYHGGVRSLSDYVYFQYVAKQLHADAFADVDPAENLRQYYRTWLPIPADGLFMWRYTPGN